MTETSRRVPDDPGDLPEIHSFNVLELDVSGLDMRLELTTLLPRVMSVDCGPSYNCSCHGNTSCTCHRLEIDHCGCHSRGGCACNSLTCQCDFLCEMDV